MWRRQLLSPTPKQPDRYPWGRGGVELTCLPAFIDTVPDYRRTTTTTAAVEQTTRACLSHHCHIICAHNDPAPAAAADRKLSGRIYCCILLFLWTSPERERETESTQH